MAPHPTVRLPWPTRRLSSSVARWMADPRVGRSRRQVTSLGARTLGRDVELPTPAAVAAGPHGTRGTSRRRATDGRGRQCRPPSRPGRPARRAAGDEHRSDGLGRRRSADEPSADAAAAERRRPTRRRRRTAGRRRRAATRRRSGRRRRAAAEAQTHRSRSPPAARRPAVSAQARQPCSPRSLVYTLVLLVIGRVGAFAVWVWLPIMAGVRRGAAGRGPRRRIPRRRDSDSATGAAARTTETIRAS